MKIQYLTKTKQNNKEQKEGYYGKFGGAFIPPVLENQLKKLYTNFIKYKSDKNFIDEYMYYLNVFVGRPSPLYYARNFSNYLGSKVYLKREDLNHTGSHKINNAVGQILLAKRMGAKEIIAETGAGQHGVAAATVAALMGIKCKVFMGSVDIERQAMNVKRMHLLGAEVISTDKGSATLKDAVDAALGYYIKNPDSYYLLGSQVGPHPYPTIVAYFQKIIGDEAKKQILDVEGMLPDSVFACIGGGSNAIGIFQAFLDDSDVELHGAEGGGEGFLPRTAATLNFGKPTVFQGTYSYCLVNEKDEPTISYSIAAGLDYPGISPQHSLLKAIKRARYHVITDKEAIEAYKLISRLEGIIPAIESSHAIALAIRMLKNKNKLCIINLSGRGDKDVGRGIE
ncbi:MAG: tryptophan synthase subunit beta [Bacteroidales bacterium]|jgi:tryptophan synthase beta chain|nr:tryptophan synthase subunit beta [Bacteroidales bacterium]